MPHAKAPHRKSLSLSMRISLWLIGAAIFPLLIALVMSELQSRPTLIAQSDTTMVTDAKTHAQLIDNYLANKLLSLKSLDYTPVVQQYFLDPADDQANIPAIVQNGTAIHKLTDPDISLVTFFTPQGKLLLSYSIYDNLPKTHGVNLIPPEDLEHFSQSKQFTSGVYYDQQLRQSTIELYTPVYSTALQRVLGVVRDTLTLNIIQSIVNSEGGANGSGSFAFILDQNGVRIIDPDARSLFTAIAPPDPLTLQKIQEQALYGWNGGRAHVLADPALQQVQDAKGGSASFQETPTNKQEAYQVTRQTLTSVPWTYFALTPVNVVLAVANQQLFTLILIALLVIVPAAIIGWIVGKRISSPVLDSVDSLIGNSSVLNELAKREEIAASEQVWVVDSSKVGLKSVEYYTKASKRAIWRLNDLGRELPQRQQRDAQAFRQDIELIVNIGEYLEKAVAYQDESNKKVAIAISVTNEVAMQLASGAKSTKEVANELDQVVKQLCQIVGSIQ